jgi:hypothetical protein
VVHLVYLEEDGGHDDADPHDGEPAFLNKGEKYRRGPCFIFLPAPISLRPEIAALAVGVCPGIRVSAISARLEISFRDLGATPKVPSRTCVDVLRAIPEIFVGVLRAIANTSDFERVVAPETVDLA